MGVILASPLPSPLPLTSKPRHSSDSISNLATSLPPPTMPAWSKAAAASPRVAHFHSLESVLPQQPEGLADPGIQQPCRGPSQGPRTTPQSQSIPTLLHPWEPGLLMEANSSAQTLPISVLAAFLNLSALV